MEAILEKAKAGDAEAQNDLRRHLAISGSRAEAERWFRCAADQRFWRLYPNWQRECVESAFSGRSTRPRRTNTSSFQLRYASGEAARVSIGREGFDLPTERQF
jgi:hypothetical protein